MNTFRIMNNNDGTWHIECLCVIYRALFGKHPEWAKPEGDAVNGYNTKYFVMVEDNIVTEEEAKQKANVYENKYGKLIKECEDSGNWDKFPFKDNTIVYYK